HQAKQRSVVPGICSLTVFRTILTINDQDRLALSKLKYPPTLTSLAEAHVTDDINEAISSGDLERTTLLLDEWASLFSTPLSGNCGNFLTLASGTGSASIVSLLLARAPTSNIHSSTLVAARKTEHCYEVLQAFLDSGWDINTYLGSFMGDLLALFVDSPSLLEWAIERGADPNLHSNNGGQSVLESAVIHGPLESVEVLIDKGGAHINNTNALKYAAWSGRTEMIELLLEKGAEIDEIPRPEYSLDLMYPDTGLGTALHQAVMAGQLEAVQLLLARGADPRVRNLVGKTALDLAREENHSMIVYAMTLFIHPLSWCSPSTGTQQESLARLESKLQRQNAITGMGQAQTGVPKDLVLHGARLKYYVLPDEDPRNWNRPHTIVSLLLSRGLIHRITTMLSLLPVDPNINSTSSKLSSTPAGTSIGSYIHTIAIFLAFTSAIEHCADPNLNPNERFRSSLEAAVLRESRESAQVLINMGGTRINDTNAPKFAAWSGRTEMIGLLRAKIDEIPSPSDVFGLVDTDTGMRTALH
ncbi:hypothetical protein C0993_010471, partial [Termitomyces sp. T159_Od127]